VLHRAVALAGIAETGPLLPLVSAPLARIDALIGSAARELRAWDAA
jgi:hypothetical protein